MISTLTGWKLRPLIKCTSDGNLSYGVVQPGKHRDDGVPILRVNNFANGALDLSSVMKIDQSIEQTHLRTRLTGGEVLLTLVGSTGQTVIVDERLAGWNVARAVAVIRPSNAIGPKWINICLRSHATKAYLDSRANTTVQKTLNLSDVRQIPVLIPPKRTKEFIESCVSTLDDKIELNRRMNETLESMARALFKSWFVDFDPVIDNALAAGNPIPEPLHARAKTRRALGPKRKPLPAHIQKLFPDAFGFDEEMGWIPEGWRVSDVGSEFHVTMGQSPPGHTYNQDADGTPFFQGSTDFGFRYPTKRVFCTAPKRMAEMGDALVSVRAPVGDVNMAAESCCVGRGVAAARHRSSSRSFTYYSMIQLRDRFQVYESEGTVFGSINRKGFNSLPHLDFPTYLIAGFEQHAGNIDEKIEGNSEANNTLTKLRDTLLPKLLSGELRIPDAEQLVAGSL